MRLIDYPDRQALFDALATRIADQLEKAVQRDGRASLSVPGGTTPGPLFDRLAAMHLPWDRVAVMLNDERWVDETSPRSNTALLRARLLQGPATRAHLVPLYAPAAAPEDQLAALTAGLRPHLPLSVLVLGMGADMHTASLFPGADRLAEALSPDAPPLLPMRSEAAVEPRVTLTAPVLQGAGHVHLLLTGAEKRQAVQRALGLSALEAPVRIVLDHATVHWAE